MKGAIEDFIMDAVAELGDRIEVRFEPGVVGWTIYVDVNGGTVFRLGHCDPKTVDFKTPLTLTQDEARYYVRSSEVASAVLAGAPNSSVAMFTILLNDAVKRWAKGLGLDCDDPIKMGEFLQISNALDERLLPTFVEESRKVFGELSARIELAQQDKERRHNV